MDLTTGVFLDTRSVDVGDLERTRLTATLPQWRFFPATAMALTPRRIQHADVVVTNKVVLDGETLREARNLKLVCVAATGINNVDLQTARELGIPVCNVRDYGTPSVAQHVFTLILTLATRLVEYREAVRAGRWAQAEQFCLLDYPITELAGKRLGIVGYGVLGQAVARLGEAFGMEVLIAARPGGDGRPGRLPLSELLPTVDVLSLHCPLTEETRGLIGAAELARMKPTALLINTARGGLVDEAALAEALRQGRLGGAGFDVLTREPPREGNALLAADLPNLIVTPHVAWASHESRQRLLDQVADNIRAFAAGTPRNLVT